MEKEKYIIEADYSSNLRYYIGRTIDSKGKEFLFMDKLRDYMILNDSWEHSFTLEEATKIMAKYRKYEKRFVKNRHYTPKKIWLGRVSKMRAKIK